MSSRRYRWCSVAFVASVTMAAACGSKSGLLESEASAGAAGTGSGGGGSGGVGGSTVGGSGGLDSGTDAPPPLPDCIYQEHGEPIVIFTYGEGVHTPTLAPLASGAQGAPARLGFGLIHEHFWHPNLRVAEVSVSPSWPDGVSVTQPMTEYGIDAHAPGQLLRATTGENELALFYYHADEASPNVIPGVKFRRLDAGSWTPLEDVFVEQYGGYAYAIAAGPLADAAGGWSGQGYGVTWRSASSGKDMVVSPRAAVLDASGKLVAGPLEVATAEAYPGIGASVTWSGATYLVASNARACSLPSCATRLTLGALQTGADKKTSLLATGAIQPGAGLRARAPIARSYAGSAWIAWREQPIDAQPGDDVPSLIRLARSSASGALDPKPWELEAHPDAGAELHASDQGVLLIWGERLPNGPEPHVVGHSRLRLRQFSKTGVELQELELPTTALTAGAAYAVATLEQPRSLLVAWTAEALSSSSPAVAWLRRLDCVPNGP